MTNTLLTAADLARIFAVDEAKVMRWQRQHNWPKVQVGREVRWTPEQVDEIKAKHSITGGNIAPADGRTQRSASRRKAS